jgi:hypothetical protein
MPAAESGTERIEIAEHKEALDKEAQNKQS